MSWFISIFVALFLVIPQGIATFPKNHKKIKEICSTIYVDRSGKGDFKSIQEAINSVPSNNAKWICIHINAGTYREKVAITNDKPFIHLEGSGERNTYVVWNDHDSIETSATFTSQADNIVAENLTFMNSYNYPFNSGNPIKTALAARIEGDKTAFYKCAFIGFQDTLWDLQGRHYFKHCTIQGAVDFIFGSGQSLYQSCIISVVAGALNGSPGFITAQGRYQANDTNGFVFKNCNILGSGMTYLGRPWRDHARVIFYYTSMSDIIVPQGWDAWYSTGQEEKLTFDEVGCSGLGSKSSGRVSWANKLNRTELQQLATISFIDGQHWL